MIRGPLIRDPWGRRVVGALCGYEAIALVLGLPTLTELSWRSRRILGFAIVASLAHHLLVEEYTQVQRDPVRFPVWHSRTSSSTRRTCPSPAEELPAR